MFTFLIVTLYTILGFLCFWLACRQTKRQGIMIDKRRMKDYLLYYGLLWPIGAITRTLITLVICWNGFCEFLVDKVNNK